VKSYSRSHLSGQALDCSVDTHLARRHDTTAELLADFAEVDERQRYLVLGYPSMFAYCLSKLHSEDSAGKHLQAARAARRFPIIFHALAEGRLHLSAVVMLAPRLTNETADNLVAAATHKTKSEIAQLLAERFPRPDVPATVRAIPPAMEHVSAQPMELACQQHAPGHVESPDSRPKVKPLAPSATRCNSRSVSATMSCCTMRRSCSATRSPRETSARCSFARCVRWFRSSRSASLPQRTSRASRGDPALAKAGISPRMSDARSASATVASARSSARTVTAARRAVCSSSIMCANSRAAATQRSTT
jgi:hypothetical protein